MNDNNGQTHSIVKEVPRKEKTLLEIFQLILKNKYILLSSVLIFLLLALIYIFTATPRYEANVTLKKESNPEDRRFGAPDISTMLTLQSMDVIETEIQLVTTHTVISKVTDDLDLFCTIQELKWGNEESYKIEKTYLDMLDPSFRSIYAGKFIVPQKFEITFFDTSKRKVSDFIIRKESDNSFTLIDAVDFKVIAKSIIDTLNLADTSNTDELKYQLAKISTNNFTITINWPEAPINSELIFSFNDFDKTVGNVRNNTKVSREGKTDIFYITYSASSPTSAAVIVNTIVEKFRESRIAQKKELIRYSYAFVDKQLNEIQEKLKASENQLSSFKASGQIMSIDASSQELTGFLSNLEAEKYNTDLQLSDYKNRASDLEKELKKNGYFDQSYLNPQGQVDGGYSPFSQLMRQLSDLELQRIELLQKRTENHPDVIALDDQIKSAKSKLASFNENTITAYKIIINTLEKKLLKINDLMSKYEVKLRSLPSKENKMAELMRERGTYEKIFTILLDQREAMRVAELSKMQDITIVDGAKVPEDPAWPKKPLIVLVGLILGGFLGILAIFSVELYRTRFVNLDELETEFQVPILSIIPKYSKQTLKALKNSNNEYKLAALITNDNGLIETYRLFRTKLFQKLSPENKIIMITSCEENSGKTSVAANLAVSLSQEGKKVLLVDCDLRKGDLSKLFGLERTDTGLIDYLSKDVNPKIYSRASKLIDILPAGGLTEDSGTILNSPKMKSLFSYLSHTNYDLIIFDSPPVTRVVDPLVLAQFIKDVIIVVRPDMSLIDTVRWGMQELKQANVRIKGIVANASEIEHSYYYRYRYGYGYGYGKDEGIKKTRRRTVLSKKQEINFNN